MRTILLTVLIHISFLIKANDGAYFVSGNQLIPIEESQISIVKEVLKIERVENNNLLVTVNYTFNNPSNQKEILVGFEAPSPSGDVDGTPINGRHPYIDDFQVNMNGTLLPFNTSIVRTGDYYNNGKITGLTEQEAMGPDFNDNEPNFFYVYHFKAKFNSGINTISHVYKFQLSGSFNTLFEFEYILTAATRWANKQIDDFTLILDLGEYVDYNIRRSFFDNNNSWEGATRILEGNRMPYSPEKKNPMRVITNTKPIVFKQLNFKPEGELSIYKEQNIEILQAKEFDYKIFQLPYNVKNFKLVFNTKDIDSYKILRNLPFARRGYIFKTPLIQDYYESLDWYSPDPNYKADLNTLSEDELEWLKILKEKHN